MTPHETASTGTPGAPRATAPPPRTFGPQDQHRTHPITELRRARLTGTRVPITSRQASGSS